MHPKTLIIGYGSPIRGDDAIGPLAADALAASALPPGVEVISRHILTAELVEPMAAVERVVFIDAAADGAPGEVRLRRLEPDAAARSSMAHFHDPRELLAWCQALYRHTPAAWLITATGDTFDYANYCLSPTAAAALDQVVAQTLSLLTATRETSPPASGPACLPGSPTHVHGAQ